MFSSLLSTWLCFLTITITIIQATAPPVHIKGSRFFYENGTEFIVRGLSYFDSGESGYMKAFVDVLSSDGSCSRDISYFQELGINTITVWDLEPLMDHSACMSELADAGIYTIVALTSRMRLATTQVVGLADVLGYAQFANFESLVDTFHSYSNVLGFLIGLDRPGKLPLLRTATASVKKYMKQKSYRSIPVGRLNNQFRLDVQGGFGDFVNCGDRDTAADFLYVSLRKFDDTSCGTLVDDFRRDFLQQYASSSIPTILTYGCRAGSGHTPEYAEIQSVLGQDFTRAISGLVLNSWCPGGGNDTDYGIVDIVSGKVQKRPQYDALSRQFALLPTQSRLLNETIYTPSNTAPSTCSTATLSRIEREVVSGSTTTTNALYTLAPEIPSKPDKALCSCMMDTLACSPNPTVNQSAIHEFYHEECDHSLNSGPKCDGVTTHFSIGKFGSYASCNYTEIAAWVINQRFLETGRNETFCKSMDFSIRNPIKPDKQGSVCKTYLKQVGPDATGRITNTPSASASTDESRSSLTTAAKALIGVSVALSFTIAATIAAYCIMSRRRRKIAQEKVTSQNDQSHDSTTNMVNELPAIDVAQTPTEIDGCRIHGHELPVNEPAGIEMPGTDRSETVLEMDSETVDERKIRMRKEGQRVLNGTDDTSSFNRG